MKTRIPLIFLLFLPLLLPAQVYNVTRYSTTEGLIQSQVRALLEDDKGFLWLGTHRGVSKFDGQRFTNYTTKSYPKQAGNFLTDLLEDLRGRIWIATDKGLSRFDGRSFRTYSTREGLPSPDIQSLLQDQDGRIWVGDASGNISLIESDILIPTPYRWQGPAQERSIHDMLEDQKGHIWIATNRGLFKWKGQFIEPFLPAGLPAEMEIFDLLQDYQGNIWLGTSNGVYRLNRATNASRETPYQIDFYSSEDGLPDNRVFCMVSDSVEQTVWFGTGRGIAYYQSGEVTPIVRTDRILDYQMRSATIDREGDLWFGTEGGGVRKVTRGIFEKYNMEVGMSSNIAKSFLQDDQGKIWISTYDQGVNILPPNTNVFKMRDELKHPDIGGNDISYSYEDRAGNFWFCFYSGGITRYDGRTYTQFGPESGLISASTYCVTEDHLGQIWVATDQGVYRQKEGLFEPIGLEDSLADEAAFILLEDADNRMWIGTSKRLTIWDKGVFSHHSGGPGRIGDNIISFLEDPKGRIWIASSKGLTSYNPETDSFHYIRISGAEGAEVVVSFAMEPTSLTTYLWIGTENGAYRMDLDAFSYDTKPVFEHYTQKDGLPSMECNANAAFVDAEGNVWLGTAEGAIRKPAGTERKPVVLKPGIYITDVQASQDSSWKELGYVIDRKTGLPVNLSLPHTENSLSFRFIGISLNSPQQIEYKHRLVGTDEKAWSEVKSTRQTTFSIGNLIPGTYTFEVIAKKESSKWDEQNPAQFTFTIRRPYYQTWWFRGLLFLIFLGVAYAFYRAVTNRRRQREREQMMQNKAEKLTLEHQALYAMMNPHFTFNALQSIQYYIHRQDKISANKFLSSFARLIRKNLESTKSEFISLGEEVERLGLYLSLEKMRFHEKIEYEVEVDFDVDQHNTLLPPMILQPFVENSIKHGIMPLEGDGKVKVHISILDEDHLQVLIQDNGIGIAASKIKKADRPNDHVSKGMEITKDRLKLFADMTNTTHSLDIEELKDEAGKVCGTQVRMILPLYM